MFNEGWIGTRSVWILIWGITFSQCTQHSKFKDKTDIASCLPDELTEREAKKVLKQINGEEKTRAIDEIFRKKRLAGFNGNVLIAQKGVVLYEKSFGYAHLKQKDSLTANHCFQLASLSKPFTAIAILRLQEMGKLSIEDSVRKFFPDFPYSGVQIKSLLSHRSGLPNYAYVFTDSVRTRIRYPNNADILRWTAIVKPKPYNLPNRYFSYSNTNYSILASIVEKVSGEPFHDFVREQIFQPLGMQHSYVCNDPHSSGSGDSLLHTAGHQHGRIIPKDNYDDIVGDKGLFSTTGDLYRFYRGLFSNCLLEKKTLEEAFTPRSFERAGTKNYGYGFRMHLDGSNQVKYIYHGGWWKGYNTMMWMSPKDDFVVIILGNSYNRTVYQIKEILDILHGEVQSDDVEKDI